jgi:hypothetical protein
MRGQGPWAHCWSARFQRGRSNATAWTSRVLLLCFRAHNSSGPPRTGMAAMSLL